MTIWTIKQYTIAHKWHFWWYKTFLRRFNHSRVFLGLSLVTDATVSRQFISLSVSYFTVAVYLARGCRFTVHRHLLGRWVASFTRVSSYCACSIHRWRHVTAETAGARLCIEITLDIAFELNYSFLLPVSFPNEIPLLTGLAEGGISLDLISAPSTVEIPKNRLISWVTFMTPLDTGLCPGNVLLPMQSLTKPKNWYLNFQSCRYCLLYTSMWHS